MKERKRDTRVPRFAGGEGGEEEVDVSAAELAAVVGPGADSAARGGGLSRRDCARAYAAGPCLVTHRPRSGTLSPPRAAPHGAPCRM